MDGVKKSQYSLLLRDLDKDITEQEQLEKKLETTEDCKDFVIHYVNILERIAFLGFKDRLPKDIEEYFKKSFEYSLGLMNWSNKIEREGNSSWENLQKHCKKNNIQEDVKNVKRLNNKYEEFKNKESYGKQN